MWIINFQNEIMNKQRGERKKNQFPRPNARIVRLALDSNSAQPKTYHTMSEIISMSAKRMKLCVNYISHSTHNLQTNKQSINAIWQYWNMQYAPLLCQHI